MHGFFSSIFGLFLSPIGIVVLAALDSTVLFFLPVAVDAAVVVMTARHRDWFWLFPLLAAAGSMAGLILTYFMGAKIGETGLERWIARRKLDKVRSKIGKTGVFALSVAALLPPPFPLAPIVLTGGALKLDKKRFFSSLAAMRFLRFMAEAALALLYGRRILVWIESVVFGYVISGLMILAIAGTAVTVINLLRQPRSRRRTQLEC